MKTRTLTAKTLSILLTLCMLLCTLPVSVFAADGAEDTAVITGLSITVDGVTYDSSNTSANNPAVITRNTQSIIITAHGTNLQNATVNNYVEYLTGHTSPLSNSSWSISEDGTAALCTFSYSQFKSVSTAFELQYSNDGSENWNGSGVYILYDESVGGEVEFGVASVTKDDTTTHYKTLTAAIQAVRNCTAADNAVVKLEQNVDVDTYQEINYGVFVFDLNGKKLTGSACGLYITSGDVTITDTGEGGTITGAECDLWLHSGTITLTVGENGEGATFPDGLTVQGGTLKEILGEGAAYWQDGKQVAITDDQTEITGGTVTVRHCNHEANTNTQYTPNDDGITHSQICSLCSAAAKTENHTGGEATCVSTRTCQVCATAYGEIDSDNHVGPFTPIFDWPEDLEELYMYVSLKCACDGEADYADVDGENFKTVSETAASNCRNPGSITYSVTVTLNGQDYTETNTYTLYSDDHTDQDENGFCSCGGYQRADYDEERDVYQISSAGQLYWYARYLNEKDANIYAELTKDIIIPENAPNWQPINCTYVNFDGNFHTISGMKCIGDDDMRYVGMFGNEGWWYEISDLHITDSYFEGKEYVGAVVANLGNGGSVENCSVTNTTVKGDSGYMGGLVGYLFGDVINCHSTATVDGEYGDVLVGRVASNGTVENSYYLSDTETEDGGKTAEQFESGQVAYLLQSGMAGEEIYDEELGEWVIGEAPHIWGQTIGTDAYPVLNGTKVYYGYASCAKDAELIYSNEKSPSHTGTLTYTINKDDSSLHDATYSCCGDVVTEAHTFDHVYDADCNLCGTIREVELPLVFCGNSVSEDVSGLAFRFDVDVLGMTINDIVAIYDGATINGYKLIKMGAIATNGVDTIDIPCVHLCDLKPDSCSFAVRVIDIPTDKYDVAITATPYVVLEIDGVATTIYGEAYTASYNGVANG